MKTAIVFASVVLLGILHLTAGKTHFRYIFASLMYMSLVYEYLLGTVPLNFSNISIFFVGSVLSSAKNSHNRLRRKTGAKSLKYNNDLAEWAQYFADNCDCAHETWNRGSNEKKIMSRL